MRRRGCSGESAAALATAAAWTRPSTLTGTGTPATALPRSVAALPLRSAALPLAGATLPAESRAALTGWGMSGGRSSLSMTATMTLSVAVRVELPSTRPECEVGRFALRRLTFRSRQRRADQWTMAPALSVRLTLFDLVAFVRLGRVGLARIESDLLLGCSA